MNSGIKKKIYSFPWKIDTTINITILSVKYVCYRQAQHYKTGKYNAWLSKYSLNIYSSTISENRIIKYPPGKKMNYFSFSLAYLSGQWINYKSLLLLPVLWRERTEWKVVRQNSFVGFGQPGSHIQTGDKWQFSCQCFTRQTRITLFYTAGLLKVSKELQ